LDLLHLDAHDLRGYRMEERKALLRHALDDARCPRLVGRGLDRPAKATWLAADEKAWLEGEMQKEKKTLAQHRSFSVPQTLVNWRVLALAAIHF
jgi:ATP-dependent DNA ligase